MKILTGGQFRELDLYTITHEPVASVDLMERAARALTAALMRRWPERERRFFVFAGPGGNGGDGLAVARMLTDAGYVVTSYLFCVGGRLSADCAEMRSRLQATDAAQLVEITTELVFPKLQADDIVIDALFGTGLSKPLSGGFAVVAKRINMSPATVVALDMPSGLMAENNAYNDTSAIIQAALTLTIQLPKLAFLFAENQRYVGDVECVDIGLSQAGLDSIKTHIWLTEHGEMRSLLRRRPRFAHKGTMGHALLVAGSRGMAGAAILATRAALRAGAGKVSLHTPHSCLDVVQGAVPEAIVRMDVDPDVLSQAYDATSYQAIAIGPGIGRNKLTAQVLHSYLSQQVGPMLLDADALNILSDNRDWLSLLPADTILTPHPLELERLVGHSPNSYEQMNRARQLAMAHHVFVVVKGRYTEVCTPTGSVLVNPTGNPGMATAGSGDVLTGIIVGLLAQGYLPAEAVQLGVYLHGLAGDIAAGELSEEALIASDIVAHLPHAFRRLRQG